MSLSPLKLRTVLFSLPTETILLQILLLPPSSSPPSSSTTHHHLPTTISDPSSDLSLADQALSSAQTLLSRSFISLLPVDFFFEGDKLVDSLLPFTTTTDEDGSKTAWFVGLVHPDEKDEGHGEWFGRPEAVFKVETELDKATLKRAVGLVRAKTDKHYL